MYIGLVGLRALVRKLRDEKTPLTPTSEWQLSTSSHSELWETSMISTPLNYTYDHTRRFIFTAINSLGCSGLLHQTYHVLSLKAIPTFSTDTSS